MGRGRNSCVGGCAFHEGVDAGGRQEQQRQPRRRRDEGAKGMKRRRKGWLNGNPREVRASVPLSQPDRTRASYRR